MPKVSTYKKRYAPRSYSRAGRKPASSYRRRYAYPVQRQRALGARTSAAYLGAARGVIAPRIPSAMTPYRFTRSIDATFPITLTEGNPQIPVVEAEAEPRWWTQLSDFAKVTEFYELFSHYRIVSATVTITLATVSAVDTDGAAPMNHLPDNLFPICMMRNRAAPAQVGADARYSWDELAEQRASEFHFTKRGDSIKLNIPPYVYKDVTGLDAAAEGVPLKSPWLDADASGGDVAHGMVYSAFKLGATPFPYSSAGVDAEQIIYQFNVRRDIVIDVRGPM